MNDLLEFGKEMKAHSWEIKLWPKTWKEYDGATSMTWNEVKLVASERPSVPKEPGLYTLIAKIDVAAHPANSPLMYVGRTKNLWRRFGEYLHDERVRIRRPLVYRLLNQCGEYIWFYYTTCPDSETRLGERRFHLAFMPPCNSELPGVLGQATKAFP